MTTNVDATMQRTAAQKFVASLRRKRGRVTAIFGLSIILAPAAHAPFLNAPVSTHAASRAGAHSAADGAASDGAALVAARPSVAPALPGVRARHTLQTAAAATPTKRRVVDKHWVGLWHTAGGPEDELFGMPRELLATNDGVVVLDVGTLQLSAFGRDGSHRWTVGRKGNGPGEFARPVDLALMPNGDIAVLDPDNSRVSVFGTDGRYKRAIGSPSAVVARSVCVSTDGQLHFLLGSLTGFLETTNERGVRVGALGFPWPVPEGSGSFLRSANFARGAARAECTLSTTFGFGNARVMPSGKIATTPFIESVRAPVIVSQRVKGVGVRQTMADGENAALSSFQSGDTLFVNFAGASDDKFRILDLYDASGRYLESWKLPVTGFLAYRDGFLFAMTNTQETADLVALVPAADTARILKSYPRRAVPRPTRKRQVGR